MVHEKLFCVLDDLKGVLDSHKIDPKLLCSYFENKTYLDRNEIYNIVLAGNTTSQINVFCDVLKSKPDDIFLEIQKLFTAEWENLFDFLKDKLRELNFNNLLYTASESDNNENRKNVSMEIKSTQQPIWADSIGKIRNNLKEYLHNDVELIFKYWDKMDVTKINKWENFYYSEIVFTDEFRNSLKFDNFNALFKEQNFKRIVVAAPAGYGKSTFVHEMVYQWINNYEWAKEFTLVFLFRLGEIRSNSNWNKSNPLSLTELLKTCLRDETFQLFKEEMYSNSLFVFDGFDELQRELVSDDVYDLIVGKSKFKPYVVVTSRPDRCFEAGLRGSCNIYIELKGFTEEGVLNQFKIYGLDFKELDLPLDVAKVPLFATLFGLLKQEENTATVTNPCFLIDKTVKHFITRYQKDVLDFSSDQETELMYTLGQAAQARFHFFRLYNEEHEEHDKMDLITSVLMPDFFTSQNNHHLKTAKAAHLILPSSSESEIFFPHQLFADYFAAFFWFKKQEKNFGWTDFTFETKSVTGIIVRFTNDFCCESSSWFSAFLSFFSNTYKNSLWKTLETSNFSYLSYHIPLFHSYEDLPCIQVKNDRTLNFFHLSHCSACLAMKKLKFSNFVYLWYLRFDYGCLFDNLSNVEELNLWRCSVKFSGQQFISAYNVESLYLKWCTFDSCENASNYVFEYPQHSKLKCLRIYLPKGQVSNFLSEIIKTCKNLKLLELWVFVEFDWINSLETKIILEGKIRLGRNDCRAIETVDDAANILKNDYIPLKHKHFYFMCEFA